MTIKQLFTAASCAFLLSACQATITEESSTTKNACPGTPANRDSIATWFPHEDTPRPSDDSFDDSTICNFHIWSWQMFLWLTQDHNGQPRFLSFETPYSVLGIENREVLLPTLHKGTHTENFDEYLQAGPDGILVDHNGNPVYYSQYLDDNFVQFIKDNDLTNPAAVRALKADTSFTPGVLEIKASWRIVEQGEDVSDVFTRKSSVYALKKSKGKIVVNTAVKRDVTLALVGFHIGGVVEDHPEMIWATFEHKSNAPNVEPGIRPTDIVSTEDYSFYTANTEYTNCNDPSGVTLNEATQKLSPVTQVCRQYTFGNAKNDPSTSTVPDGTNPENQYALDNKLNNSILSNITTNTENIISLNTIVRERLDDVFANYREVGAIWFAGKNRLEPGMHLTTDLGGPKDAPNQLLIGSLKLSNATIETFTQVASAQENCFRCHNTVGVTNPKGEADGIVGLKAMNLNISHAFLNMYFWSQEMENVEKALGAEK